MMSLSIRKCYWLILLPVFLGGNVAFSHAKTAQIKDNPQASFLKVADRVAFGDLDDIRKRGFLRVLVVPNKTHYFVDRGQSHGISYEVLREFEKTLNAGFPRKQKKFLAVMFIPVHRDEIFKRLSEGRGDLAVANLTMTPERQQQADFSSPFYDHANEIIAASPTAAPLITLEDLSGKAVYVRRSSSFYSHLQTINADFAQRGIKPIRIQAADEALEAEDLLEMLQAGLIQYTVIDQHVGEFWAKVFPKIALYPDIKVAVDQTIAWAMRQHTPQLLSAVNSFMVKHRAGTSTGNTLLKRYLQNTKWAKNAAMGPERARFERTIEFFRKYAGRYDFDPLMLAAQGFQESGLDQKRRSRVGAIGVMQLMPATGREMRVGDIRHEEANIHAGSKYMRQLIDVYFDDPALDPLNRTLFAFAGYNAGPGRVKSLRKTAAERGFNPNLWFGNVETIASMKVGAETTQYVSNIFKYYVAYKLIIEEGFAERL